jgi:hypothetical protein
LNLETKQRQRIHPRDEKLIPNFIREQQSD